MLKHTIVILLFALQAACAGLDEDPTKNWTAQDFYDEAQTALNGADFESAIKYLETLEARFPFDPYAKQAQLDIAYSYYKFDEPESAISAIDRFMRLHPRDPHIDYAYYLKGLVNFHRGRSIMDNWFERDPSRHDPEVLHAAFNAFSTLVRRFPDSRYAGDAWQRMIYLRNELAEQEINVAEYYLERGTWLAAANRAKAVIETYQQSKWVHRALEIMVEAYQNLGFNDLARDARRVLELNRSGQRPVVMEAEKVADTSPKESG